MTADQLLGHVPRHRGEVAGAALLEQQRQEVDLEEDVAELVEQLGVIAALRRIGELVGLLDRVRDDRSLVLLAVPRALAPEAVGDLVERAIAAASSSERRRRGRHRPTWTARGFFDEPPPFDDLRARLGLRRRVCVAPRWSASASASCVGAVVARRLGLDVVGQSAIATLRAHGRLFH